MEPGFCHAVSLYPDPMPTMRPIRNLRLSVSFNLQHGGTEFDPVGYAENR